MSDFSADAVLVTGGAGFIGSNFVRHLLATDENVRVVNIDKLTYAGSTDNLRDLPDEQRHEFVRGDINDRSLLDELFKQHLINAVVHLAAESHVDRSIDGPAAFIDTNILGTYHLLESAREHWRARADNQCRFLHVSTDEVFGSLEADEPAFAEDTAYAPNSPYSASKAAADHLVRAWHHTYDLPVITTNCSNNYGPYQNDEKLIPTVIRSCARSEPIPVYGDGSNIRDWLHVEDHCKGIMAALQRGQPNETYNLGGNNELSNLEIVELICSVMDEVHPDNAPHERLICFVTDRPGHDWRYAISADKAFRDLNWRPTQEFGPRLRETVEWYLNERYGD